MVPAPREAMTASEKVRGSDQSVATSWIGGTEVATDFNPINPPITTKVTTKGAAARSHRSLIPAIRATTRPITPVATLSIAIIGGPLKVRSPKPSFQSNRPVLVATAPTTIEMIGSTAIRSAIRK